MKQHLDSPDNKPDVPWEFSASNKEKMKERKRRAEKNRKLRVTRLRIQQIQKQKPMSPCRHYLKGRCTEATQDMAVTLLEIARIFATKVSGKIDVDVLQLLWKGFCSTGSPTSNPCLHLHKKLRIARFFDSLRSARIDFGEKRSTGWFSGGDNECKSGYAVDSVLGGSESIVLETNSSFGSTDSAASVLNLPAVTSNGASKKQLDGFISSLHGQVASLLKHTVGSMVIENAYQLANGAQKRDMLMELYSTELQLFKDLSNIKESRQIPGAAARDPCLRVS